MGHTTFNFTSNNQEFFGQFWAPETAPKAVICHSHGHGDHSGRYAHIAEYFVARGVAFITFDHYGHGQTESKRGHAPSYDAILDSVGQLINEANSRWPEAPKFLYGHSMGGNIILNYALKRKPDIKGVITSAPWIKAVIVPTATQLTLAKVMGKIYPSFTQPTKLPAESISTVEAEVKRYAADPLVHDMISPVLYFGCYEAGLYALEHAAEFTYPLLIMHGTADTLTDHDASHEFSQKVNSQDVMWKSWEGLFHEIHNEHNKEEVIGMMGEWVKARIDG